MRNIVLVFLCLLLTAGTALAEKTVTITPITDEFINPNFSGSQGVCQMGNLNTPFYAIPDWIWGAESYKYMFDADRALCPNCPSGFQVEEVHMFMQFGPEDVPSTFEVVVDLEEALWDPTLGCFVPGPEICVSPVYSITIDAPGAYDINLPLDLGQCPCAAFDYWYGISFTFLTAFNSGMEPDAVSDNLPVGCTSWNDYGAGWLDLQSFGWPGEIIMFADIVCCSPPVPEDKSTWGEVKSLFR